MNKRLLLNELYAIGILLIAAVLVSNSSGHIRAFGDLSWIEIHSNSRLINIFDGAYGGGINPYLLNIAIKIRSYLLNTNIRYYDLFSYSYFIVSSYIGFRFLLSRLNNNKNNDLNLISMIYAFNPVVIHQIGYLQSGIYSIYILMPVIFLPYIKSIECGKFIIKDHEIILVAILSNILLYHPSFVFLYLLINIYLLICINLIELNIKNTIKIFLYIIIFISPTILISVLNIYDITGNNETLSQKIIEDVFRSSQTSFGKIIEQKFTYNYFLLDSFVWGVFLSTLIILCLNDLKNRFIKITLFPVIFIIFIYLKLPVFQEYKLLGLNTLKFLYAFRTNDKLLITLPFLLLFSAAFLDYKKLYRLFGVLIISLGIMCGIQDSNRVFNPREITKNEYKRNVYLPNSIFEVKKYIDINFHNKKILLLTPKNWNENFKGWIEYPQLLYFGVELLGHSVNAHINFDKLLVINSKTGPPYSFKELLNGEYDDDLISAFLSKANINTLLLPKYIDEIEFEEINRKISNRKIFIKNYENDGYIIYKISALENIKNYYVNDHSNNLEMSEIVLKERYSKLWFLKISSSCDEDKIFYWRHGQDNIGNNQWNINLKSNCIYDYNFYNIASVIEFYLYIYALIILLYIFYLLWKKKINKPQ